MSELRDAVKDAVMDGLNIIAICQTGAHLDMVAESVVKKIEGILATDDGGPFYG